MKLTRISTDNKLNRKHIDWICKQLAMRINSQQTIAKLFYEIFDIKITQQTVSHYANSENYKDRIYQFRIALQQDMRRHCDVANPIVQIKLLENMLDGCLNPPAQKGKYGSDIIPMPNYKEAREIIKLIAQLSGCYSITQETSLRMPDSEVLKSIDAICRLVQRL